MKTTTNLFAYGILQDPAVMQSIIGRHPANKPARLLDHRRFAVRNANYPGVVQWQGIDTQGTLFFDLSEQDLVALDAFEGDMYERVQAQINLHHNPSAPAVATIAWIYRVRHEFKGKLSEDPWEFAVDCRQGNTITGLEILINPYSNPQHLRAVIEVLDSYASSPSGGATPLSADSKLRLAAELPTKPWVHTFLALLDNIPSGF
ncbi:MAG: gamma-glutamylcyclotransferase [Verrucomicrobia bacterium]|nr:gamma-glutamylcyclotransferase [Verrucomicrobiota bacterium]